MGRNGEYLPGGGRNRACGAVIWLTGLSGAGKSTIAKLVTEQLCGDGIAVEWLDGDEMRLRLGRGLGFNRSDRDENVRRIAYVAGLLARHGVIVIVSAISPYRSVRDEIRRTIAASRCRDPRPSQTTPFLEVFVNAPLARCEQRDVKGLYKRARAGELRLFTGVDSPYEPPVTPEVECDTERETPIESADKVIQAIAARTLAPEYRVAIP